MLIILRILVEGDIYGFNRRFGAPEKGLILNLVKQTQKVVWVYIIVLVIVVFC